MAEFADVNPGQVTEHAHSPFLRHHFEDMAQQFDSSTLGMWVFLLTEIMFFGGMFGAYTVYRSMYPDAFASTSKHMIPLLGATNTAVLICSSLTMALAVRWAHIGSRALVRVMIILTMIFGLAFIGVKFTEYYLHYKDHLVPWLNFQYPEHPALAHNAEILFCFYFFMTGFHALHMFIGLGLLTYLLIKNEQILFGPDYYSPVEIVGLYWHFVDIVWIFLFPLLYLIGAHG